MSKVHQDELQRLGQEVEAEPLSPDILLLEQTKQIVGMSTIIQNPMTNAVDFQFYFNRLSTLLVERYELLLGIVWIFRAWCAFAAIKLTPSSRAMEIFPYTPLLVTTPQSSEYKGLSLPKSLSAVVVLRGGSCLETGLRRVIPDCATGRILIQTNYRTGEPELHFSELPKDIMHHDGVLVLDTQMSSGGAALMAVRVLVDHGVKAKKIVFVCFSAGKVGMNRLLKVFPGVRVVVGRVEEDWIQRWIEKKYFGC